MYTTLVTPSVRQNIYTMLLFQKEHRCLLIEVKYSIYFAITFRLLVLFLPKAS